MQSSPRPGGDAARLALGFGALVALTFGLIVLGALVRAHEAGLACPDWPLCFGELVPRMNVKVAFEWSHRALAGSVALGFAGLALATLRSGAATREIRQLLALAAVLLGVQILLGALTVWQLLASWTVTSHLVTGNAFAAALAWTAATLREQMPAVPQEARASDGARRTLSLAAALLLLQMVLGGLVSSRYAGMACPEWPTCNGGLWFPTWSGPVGLHLLHRTNGYALLVMLALGAWVCRREPRLRALANLALALGIAQVLVGIANVVLGIPVEVTGLHSALAALLVLAMTLAMRQAWHRAAAAPPPGC